MKPAEGGSLAGRKANWQVARTGECTPFTRRLLDAAFDLRERVEEAEHRGSVALSIEERSTPRCGAVSSFPSFRRCRQKEQWPFGGATPLDFMRSYKVCTERFLWQKLAYMHRNPQRAGLVQEPGAYAYLSYRSYEFGEEWLLEVDRGWG